MKNASQNTASELPRNALSARGSELLAPPPGEDETRLDPSSTPAVAAAAAGSVPGDAARFPPAAGGTQSTETLPGASVAQTLELRQVGRYLIKERIGRGGMATVFRAHDPGIGRDVAIKFLNGSLWEVEEYRSRFLREARAAGGLSHASIVTVHDVGEIDGRPYMAMELLVGQPLSELMEPGRTLPVREAVVTTIQLARALDYAHAHGIVHRDIKPGNIVRLAGSLTIKVTDFGIAHMESSGAGEQRTRVGDVLGTPQYMSPEQMQGRKLDGRSDLFSVGIVLYQMLSGQRPFQADGPVALALKIIKEEAPPLEKLRPDLPAALRRIVARCLAKLPEQRFQTGRELSEALSRVLADLDEAQHRNGRPRIVPLRVKWAATMALTVAVVMGLAATVTKQRQDAALMAQVADYGASLARFIAAQNAVAALAEDWAVVEVTVQQIMKTGDFRSVTVIDRAGIVRASGDAALIGLAYQAPAAETLGTHDGAVALTRHVAGGEPVLGFTTPITFQNKPVGRVALALPERPLLRVARISMGLMAALVVITVLAAGLAMYLVAHSVARPIRQLSVAMEEIARGRFGHRIAEARKDEFGLLIAAFDKMAQALQDARHSGGATIGPPTPTPLRSAAPRDEPP